MAIQDIDLGTVIENGEDGDVARTAFTKVNENFDDLDTRVTAIESLDIGTVTSVNDVLPVDGNVDLTPADIGAATAAQGAKADTAVQADVFATALNQKVDKVNGYQLSQEDYTTEEKNKLAGLESSLFLGVYGSLAELEAAHPTSDRPGEYAFIPAGGNIYMFVWDTITRMWVTIGSGSEAITAEQVKTLYESNPDTNAFTNNEKTKLAGIAAGAQANVATNISQGTRTDTTIGINSSTGTGATLVGASITEAGVMVATDKAKLNGISTGATVNQTDAYLLNRANHTGSQPISSVTNLQSSLDNKENSLIAGTNITIDRTNPASPIINAASGSTPVIMSGQVGSALYSAGQAAPFKIPFADFKVTNPDITYDSTNRRFYINRSGIYRVSCSAQGTAGINQLLIGLNIDTPLTSANEDNATGVANVTLRVEATINITAGQYIVFYFSSGTFYNQSTNRFGGFSIQKIG